MPRGEAGDYKKLKQAILYRMEVSTKTYHLQFRARKNMEERRPSMLLQSLRDLVQT